MLSNIQIKSLKRILKEIGIYNLWLKEREKTTKGRICGTFGLRVDKNGDTTLSNIIDDSFWWDMTKNPELWEGLYSMNESNMDINKLSTKTNCLIRLKECVNRYF